MKIMLEAFLHFDGTTMAIEVACLHNDEDELLMDHNGVGAKVIEFLRAKGFDVYDKRAEFADPPKAELVTYSQVEQALDEQASAGDRPRPLYPEPIESHHVTHADPSLPKPREEISL